MIPYYLLYGKTIDNRYFKVVINTIIIFGLALFGMTEGRMKQHQSTD